MKKAFLIIAGILLLAVGVLFGHSIISPSSEAYGSTGFTPVQGQTYYLAGAGVTAAQNTITLSSFDLPDPNKTPITNSMFSGTQYGVLEAQTSKIENVTYTGVTQNANGTATLTGVSRGISFYSPYAASSTLSLAHAGGATFILSNPAAFYAQFLTNTNGASILGTFTFASTSPPLYDNDPIWANFPGTTLADVNYVNSVVAAGCANGSQTVKGCVQLATQLQSASSTGTGSTGALLVGNNLYSTSSPGTAGLWNVWTGNDGKIAATFLNGVENYIFNGLDTFNQGFIDNASSTFTSTVNLNGTVNINGNTVSPKFGGNGVNGALTISSGTTTIDVGASPVYEQDYTSISITGTGSLAFTDPGTNGTIVILRSQGSCTDTSASNVSIDVTALGSSGNGLSSTGVVLTAGSAGVSTGGSGIATSLPFTFLMSSSSAMTRTLSVGAGGGVGGTGLSGAGGAGGRGGGALYIECAGALNFTGKISAASAGAGGNAVPGNDNGGGGGGGGGSVLILANSITANTGTITISGAAGGTGASGSASQGAGGGAGGNGAGAQGGNGGSPGGSSGGGGGSGGTGFSFVSKNTYFY